MGRTPKNIRRDGIGAVPAVHGHEHNNSNNSKHATVVAIDSLTYEQDESDAWRAHVALDHYQHRGRFWNQGKHQTMIRYLTIAMVGITQAGVAYFTNILSNYFVEGKYSHVNDLLQQGRTASAFLSFLLIQTLFAITASICVWIEPVAAGSGIPEVKCFLNGIDLPRVGDPLTLVAKVLGVICSVSAGLPVGKEGPMVHSGAVVATTLSARQTRNDRERRDFVACGAAAGVCTAFSAPIGGILFCLEEGASYWAPSLTWRTFYCSMIAFTTLMCLNTAGSALGKVGFNKLFSFGNFMYEGAESSFAVYELFLFVLIGVIGGLIGAIFNHTNERITHWRIKNVNHSKIRRFVEVIIVSMIVSTVSFALPFLWTKCTPLPTGESFSEQELVLLEELVPFRCIKGEEYNELASLIFTDAGAALRQLFHMRMHTFSETALVLFFLAYISMAVMVYGIAVPSGLFVPSLLSGAAFGRLFGNIALQMSPDLAFSNTYALIGAAAVLGGMARMTISLTVILLECTGNEQFVLPLMLTLMTARITGSLFNEDIYHIHIHLKKGVQFLDAELRSVTRHHDVLAGQVMGENVIFLRPVEKVGVVYDILKSCKHTTFPVVDTDDGGVLFGTIGRNALCVLLKQRAFDSPTDKEGGNTRRLSNSLAEKYVPIVEWYQVEKAYPKYPSVKDTRLNSTDRDCFLDLRPYANQAPITVQEQASVARTYELFRSLGMRFLPVVNRHNQVVGTITRADLSPEGLASTIIMRGKKHL